MCSIAGSERWAVPSTKMLDCVNEYVRDTLDIYQENRAINKHNESMYRVYRKSVSRHYRSLAAPCKRVL